LAVLQIISDSPRAGKTCLAGGLLALLAEAGQRAGYYKPFSQTPEDDPDVSFVSRPASGGLGAPDAPRRVGAPLPLPSVADVGPPLDERLSSHIRNEAARIQEQAGLVVMESPDLAAFPGAPALLTEVSASLDSVVVLLFRYASGLTAAKVIAAAAPFGHRLAGVIINGVTTYRVREIKEGLAAELREAGVPVLGALPEDRGMLAVTVLQIADYLGGRWVQAPVNTGSLIERFLIGGNIMDSGPTYFGRYANQAVITRSARPDIQLTSLMSGTKCLVLTEGGEPTEYIKAEAQERGVPMLLVERNTLDTAEALGGLVDLANPYSPGKTARFAILMAQHLELAALTSRLG
jgi:hypothetical protein